MALKTFARILFFHAFLHNIWSQPADSRYIMDDDNDLLLLLPFPIGVCFTAKTSNPDEQHTRYQCSSDGTQVFKKVWNTSSVDECLTNTNGRTLKTFESPTEACSTGYFDCDAINDNYVTHDLWLKKPTETCDTSSRLTLPTALGCFCTNTSSIKIACSNAYNGQFTHYSDTSCSTAVDTQSISNCTAIFTTSFGPSTFNILSQIDTCTINDTIMDKTLSPTVETNAPTTFAPTESTPAPITFGSRFIMDDDWLFGDNYPFPIDKCLQTQPFITPLGISPEFVYYECNDALDEVTKYKWTTADTAALGDDSFNCSNKSTAQTTIITTATHNNDICNANYFNCEGNDDYVTTFFQASDGNDCSSGFVIDLFATSFVTDACFCGDALSQTSYKMKCDESVSTINGFEGTSSCVNTTDSIATETGQNNECVFLQSTIISTQTFNIFGTMKECVKDNIDVFTLAPSSAPTVSSLAPSSTPTAATNPPVPQPTTSPLLPGQTVAPTQAPITSFPTVAPTTKEPSNSPTDDTQAPLQAPTSLTYPPSFGPTYNPSAAPTEADVFTSTDIDEGKQNVDDKKEKTEAVIIIVVLIVVVVCCCVAIIILWLMKSKEKKSAEDKKENTGKQHTARVQSNDYDGSESSHDESNESVKDKEESKEDEVDVEKAETTGLKSKTERKRKRKPKKRRKRKKKEDNSTDDDDVLDDAEKEKVELVTAGSAQKSTDSDSNSSDSDPSHDEEEKEAEYVTAGGPDKDSSSDTDSY